MRITIKRMGAIWNTQTKRLSLSSLPIKNYESGAGNECALSKNDGRDNEISYS